VKDDMAQLNKKPKYNELFLRTVSACALIPPVIAAIYFGSPYFEVLITLSAFILLWEWYRLCDGKTLWVLFGIIYISVPCYFLTQLRIDLDLGKQTVLWIFVLVWSADTGAFVTGRVIGGPKLAPSISPNKTWSGLSGGIFAAGIVGFFSTLILGHQNMVSLTLLSALLGLISQGGDLFESWIKRHFNKKDTGTLIPGHGGLFDRVDGLLTTSAVAATLSFYIKESPLTWG
jgi:phosphatidate cytidylyltransferase